MQKININCNDISQKQLTIYNTTTDKKIRICIVKTKNKTSTSSVDSKPLLTHMSFDKFIVGTSNQRAYSAAQAVVENPGSLNNNPFFLYSEAGLGKTHLLNAIGHAVEKENNAACVVLTTGEKFYSGLQNAIQNNSIAAFRKKFYVADYLLFDEFSFIADKNQAQDEFFLILCHLVDTGKQIVIASALAPNLLSALNPRIRLFLEPALVVDIKSTDEIMGRSILHMWAEEMKIILPEEIIGFFAQKLPNPRLLEGCLIRMTAYAKITGESLNKKLAEQFVEQFASSTEGDNHA